MTHILHLFLTLEQLIAQIYKRIILPQFTIFKKYFCVKAPPFLTNGLLATVYEVSTHLVIYHIRYPGLSWLFAGTNIHFPSRITFKNKALENGLLK
jgi:hypothetical protein